MNTDYTKNARRTLLAGLGTAALAGLSLQPTPAQARPLRAAAAAGGGIPNPTVITHEGRRVRFYDDLIRGKVVVINMTFTQCSDSCPATMGNLIQVQQMLGKRLGKGVFMYSITLTPETDTPRILRAYAKHFDVGPGWLFLTGAPSDIESLRYALGFYDRDPVLDADRTQHADMLRIGNAANNRWTMSPGLVSPQQIITTINHVDPAVTMTAHRAA